MSTKYFIKFDYSYNIKPEREFETFHIRGMPVYRANRPIPITGSSYKIVEVSGDMSAEEWAQFLENLADEIGKKILEEDFDHRDCIFVHITGVSKL